MTDWLSRFGTARITLGVDEDFSLKNSQFDFLHPWYETPDNLFFSQHTLHRTVSVQPEPSGQNLTN